MSIKRMTAVGSACVLLLTAVSPVAAEEGGKDQGDKGSFSAKHEVVYANLKPDGDQEKLYVINNFDIKDKGSIVDYGPYTSVQNLTDVNEIKQEGQKVEWTAEEDEFYYQGNLKGDTPLPWDLDVTYVLNGKEISADQLAGKDGKLEIKIKTTKNEKADASFFNNYLMQITIPMASSKFENIEAEEGTVANAGKDRQVTFTVLPEEEGDFTVTADADNMEMESIEFTAVPSSMAIDAPDIGGVKNDMGSLAEATASIDNGVGDLQNGIKELNGGVASLYDGSVQYKQGMESLNSRSSELVEGSASIQSALQQMNEAVQGGTGDVDLNDLTKVEGGLRELADSLKNAQSEIDDLNAQYGKANQALADAIAAIPGYDITEADIQALRDSGADQDIIDQLLETYRAAQAAKGAFTDAEGAFQAVSPALEQSSASLGEMSNQLYNVADQVGAGLERMDIAGSIAELQTGFDQLTSNYATFHQGLKQYTGGVAELTNSYEDIHGGIAGLTDGTAELEEGAGRLKGGTSELASATSDLPGQMQSEIDQMVEEYDKSDYEPVSFVSEKNEQVNSVQFVMKTEAVKQEEKEEKKPKKKEEKGFFERLLALFK
ncbi:hypothetical protein [Halobacillus sp. BAB-2008]|uniref:hypothetical protein n=1 Tax=Halobacillus sp. BAB-2008 TaxID=1246484 RepID=UPI0002A4F3E9|nr:hypothetical protein [Halobacillus sp. BAB-2008]ELK47782.1 X-X-X-Leu-X-X-Gly heptad repeat-containing protein [Halobacillus sp. BAB-2008]